METWGEILDEVLSTARMRAAEEAAIGSGKVTGLELMERAGQGVVAAIHHRWPDLRAARARVLVLCGPGNNGGDGFVVARLLAEAGWRVDTVLHGDPARLPPDARANHDRWVGIGPVGAMGEPRDIAPDLIVDAIFGTGLTRALPREVQQALTDLDAATDGQGAPVPRVAVDIPSGLSSDTGRALGRPLAADLTVTFHAVKLGHFLAEGPDFCGALHIADIGLPPTDPARDAPPGVVRLTGMPRGLGRGGGHKYAHGHALVLSGGAGQTGAARLAARAALRVGAGLVTLGVPGSAQQEAAAQLTAIMLRRAGDGDELTRVLDDARISAVCLGPALGLDRARDLVEVVLSGRPMGVVLDADALTAFAKAPETLFAMLHEACVLTPHDGEFARLFPDLADARAAGEMSKVDAVRKAAARAGCIVLLKGPDTVIADPDGRCGLNASVYDRSAPWLATAGSGDVLAGLITGLLARGLSPLRAAEVGAWLHTESALSFGPGLIAEDLPEELPRVFRALGL